MTSPRPWTSSSSVSTRFGDSPAEPDGLPRHSGSAPGHPEGATVPSVNEWPEDWHPVNAEEAKDYIDAHQNGGGDAELLEECASFLPIHPRPS